MEEWVRNLKYDGIEWVEGKDYIYDPKVRDLDGKEYGFVVREELYDGTIITREGQ